MSVPITSDPSNPPSSDSSSIAASDASRRPAAAPQPAPEPEPASPLAPGTRWILLCRVVDNFGDAGVCWRLARQLAREQRARVTLVIDRPELVERLAGRPGPYPGVEVVRWPGSLLTDPPPDLVVSAFGCDPPPSLRALLGGAPARPLWLNLEYLSAEPWIDGCHGLASVKPGDGAVEHYFYPGFSRASGGLLRERDAVAHPAPDRPARRAGLARLGLPGPAQHERVLTLFCYPEAPLHLWLPELASSREPTLMLVPEGVATDALASLARLPGERGHPPVQLGPLRLARIPFLCQDDYDLLLRLADLNFVRGEDSWLRAHWARRPFVWQPYRQSDATHLVKLHAFLERVRVVASGAGRPDEATAAPASGKPGVGTAEAGAEALAAMMRAWSGDGDVALAWRGFEANRGAIAQALHRWTDSLLEQDDLARNLARWVALRL